eukprot:g926.t1
MLVLYSLYSCMHQAHCAGTAYCAKMLVVAGLLLASSASSAARVFDVTDFGAVGDGTTYDTAAVRTAAEALRAAGGGTLLFPAPNTFLTGAFNVSSNAVVDIERGATILGSTRGKDWPLLVAANVWPQFGHGSDCVPGTESCRLMHQSLVFARDVRNVTVRGGGVLDCNAQSGTWWRCAKNLSEPPCSGYARPHCAMFSNTSVVEVASITVRNSPDWTLHFSGCSDVRVHHLNVTNPLEPNADGIDIDSSERVLVEDNYFSVGDDALCVKSGIDYFGRRAALPARDIVFRRNMIGTGHGITIGSETSGSVFNVTFEDITMDNTGTGIRMKSQRGRGGIVQGVTYRNIDMKSIGGQCVQITLNYHAGLEPTNATATPQFKDITLQDVHCDSAGQSYLIDGLPEQSIERLVLKNVTMGEGVGGEAKCDFATECTCDELTAPCPSCCHLVRLSDISSGSSTVANADTDVNATVILGVTTQVVDERFVSYVMDTGSLRISDYRHGIFPTYPYPVDLADARLRHFAAALAPAVFVMTSGVNNCIRLEGFGADGKASRAQGKHFQSKYCEGKEYSGALTPTTFDELRNFSADVGAGLLWHLDMADGRGFSQTYTPWDPSPSRMLLARAASSATPLAAAMLFEEVKSEKLGFSPSAGELAADLGAVRMALRQAQPNVSAPAASSLPLVYGVLDQDSDQKATTTDEYYRASNNSVDVVCFSYYQNNAAGRKPCPYDPKATAAFMLNASNRATLGTTARHFVRLAAELDKGQPQLIAGAPCTHAPEGTGWGAVNAHAGLLWYADALGRLAALGVSIYARQTLFGGSYGLLDNSTYMPTPGYWAALLHKRLLGTVVLNATLNPGTSSTLPADVSVYAHCATQSAGLGHVALLVTNLGASDAVVALPPHTARGEWVLEAAKGSGGLLSKNLTLNGALLRAGIDGSLPPLEARPGAVQQPVQIPAYSASFLVLQGTASSAQCKK